MPTADDLFDEDELSTSSSELEHSKARPSRIVMSESDYTDDSIDSDSQSDHYDDFEEDDSEEEEEEEEAWNSTKKKGKTQRPVAKLLSQPRQPVKRKKTKQEEYEGVTDSDSDPTDLTDEDVDGERASKRIRPEEVVGISFLGENKGRTVDSIVEYNPEDNLYFVKWRHRSYREASWENEDELSDFRAAIARKMQNAVERFTCISEEDLEEERERRLQYMEPERVIDMTKRQTTTWYLVKWRTLPYKECTWESEQVLFPAHQLLVDAHLNRTMMQRPVFKKPRQFIKVTKEDPVCCAQQDDRLRDYQMDGVNWLTFSWFKGVNVVLADEMGLGKTIQSVVYLNALRCKYNYTGPSMVVVPLSTIDAWQREFQRWAPQLNVIIYNGDADSRRLIRHYEFDGLDVLLTTYELVLKDKEELKPIKWRQLIVDEGHRLKNTESQLFEALNYLIPSHHRILITGTPLQNSLKELWSLLHFLDPITFANYHEFHQRYAPPEGDESPQQAEARTLSLHAILKPHLLRRMKKDVEQSLPAKREQILRIDLSAHQKDLYRLILAKNYVELQKQSNKKTGSNLINILGELKKICNHPLTFTHDTHDTHDTRQLTMDELLRTSSKLALMDTLMTRLMADGHRVLIFSQSVRMLDILEHYLCLRRWSHQRIDGGVPSDARRRAIDAFNDPASGDVAFLLSTRAGGLGINLETADTVIIYDSDWNPQNDLQAMARAHRIGQRRAVNIYRLVTSGTVEETILERAKQKMVLDHLVIQRMQPQVSTTASGDDLQAILKFGAQSLFAPNPQPSPTAPTAIDLDAILERAQDTTTVSTSKNDFLGQFQVADVGALPAWDQIIPTDERLKAEAEAAERALIAKEGALQEAILTTSHVRRTRTDGDKAVVLEAVKSGLIPDAVKTLIDGKPDDDLVNGVRVGLLRSRHSVRKQIQEYFQKHVDDPLSFRLGVKVKQPVQWTRPWGPRDDAMLLVGVLRHGFQWDALLADADLKLPFTLLKGTLPQSAHLQRRLEYLVHLIDTTDTGAGGKKPHGIRKPLKRQEEHDFIEVNHNQEKQDYPDGKQVKQWLKAVKTHVEFINNMPAEQVDSQLKPICEAVRAIGKHINSDAVPGACRESVWRAVASIWPTDMRADDLMSLYAKLC